MKIGILCPSEIALRRFLPALHKLSDLFKYAGVAVASDAEWFGCSTYKGRINNEIKKACKFQESFGGDIFDSYDAMLSSDIECVYIPLPPALHCEWGTRALKRGKHVLMEKPFSTSLADTLRMVELARDKSLALHENYMFQYHSQITHIMRELKEKTIGDLRMIRVDFGFPFRGANDFRYNKALGGGALLDCGGYTVKLASILLGDDAEIVQAKLFRTQDFEVDIYGNAVMLNNSGLTAQLSFGMDNSYRCSLDIWGSKGVIHSDRILTAPDGFEPTLKVVKLDEVSEYKLESDDTFKKSIEFYHSCVTQKKSREQNYNAIIKQAKLVDRFDSML